MFRGETLSHFSLRNAVIWFLLAFQSGMINAGGFLACGRFVSHITGFATLIGTDLAQSSVFHALGMLAVPGFFILGAMISGFLVDRRKIQGRSPRYSSVLFLIVLIHIGVLAAGLDERFGEFGEPVTYLRNYVLLALLCFVSGLQNAMVTSASGAVVRTTHLTGITTDLGIGLVRVLFHNHKLSRIDEIRAVWMRIGVIASFMLGSAIAAFIFIAHQYWGFALPTMISLVIWYMTLKHFTLPSFREWLRIREKLRISERLHRRKS
ncbi:MAG: DUF1275 domain-containing protein [Bdellovibrionaceae bacterium]|nr:DUF1275 domain-containing protein [Pseudobdellovibrionaceae bacterium]